ncbi:MAG: PD40 domain-containing protein [Planctomycetes bacterium]|nr:PD40 domain-containing protein [Planctomycetota bacterium]MBI3845433.1 PD40 domain-containing protein [Planctomycetota bacterium]
MNSRCWLAVVALGLVGCSSTSRPASPQKAAPARESQPATPAATSDKDKKDEKKWDVSNPPGPSHDVDIDVDEGTWMSLDVSPDGKEIAFDLLGDLYTIPIDGGEAKALTSGVAWDMQPRYSPDGKRIAFTSDRAGGDNIWVMNRDGSDPKAVSSETYRLLNSPAWTPDGEFIAARKHFTGHRSLGSGEIWLYHRTGGEGLQMTEKPNEQKDLGEPAFSPDGRYLYYSQDVTPGSTFEYNKDPYGEIYDILRLDREKNETRHLVAGAGGSVRPTPSPDGKRLAFVRRVRLKSVLYLRDLESGEEWPIADDLERDMQETWAIHGVYPTMAWMPDGKSIVYWAGGKIHRLDVESHASRVIPFRVKTTRRIIDAVRFPQDVAPANFDVKMLRWVEVAPDGKSVVYQALGHLYVRELPDGTPRRLTSQNDHFEFYPSYARDGGSIVYTTWDDKKLGTVCVAPARGGEGRVITKTPGHFVEPAFTPDGTKIVFRRVAGSEGGLLSPLWSDETGMFVVAADGNGDGKETLLTRDGVRPHFGAESDRVYYMDFEGEDKRVLKSIGLDGREPRTHARCENGTEFRVSPDGKWLAFRERFNAYIAPFVRTGKIVELSSKTKAIPVTRVSRDASEFLRWSGDSRKLHWSLGPELFTRDVSEAFAFVEGAPETLPSPPEKGVNVSFSQPTDVPSGSIAIVGARLVTMRGDEVIEDGTIVVDKNRIVAVGKTGSVQVPSDAKIVDGKGTTLVPGLIDVHAHGPQGENGFTPQQNWLHDAELAFGVTTVHDPSNDTDTIFASSELAKAGLVVAPRIYSTGTILYGASGDFKAEIDSLDDAKGHLRRLKAVGAFSVKSYQQPRREQRQQVIAAARELEMMVVPEGGSLFQMNMSMIADGHTGIEHSIPVPAAYRDVITFWSHSGTGFTPTLIVAYGGLFGETYWYQHTNVWENERLLTFVPRPVIDARSRRRTMAPEDDFNHVRSARIAKALVDAGGHVQLGAHGQREGLGAHWELWMFVQGGMTPMQALRAGTLDGARYIGLDRDLGSLEPGKLADLLVLDKNPLTDIRNTESLRYTMINGRLLDAHTLDELGNHPRKRASLYWNN